MNLPPDLQLRFRLDRLHPDESLRVGEWCIRREACRFRLIHPRHGTVLIPKRAGQAERFLEFRRRRAIGEVVARLMGEAYAPELKFQRIVRLGNRYAAFHRFDNGWRTVAFADTAEEAHAEYRLWLRFVHNPFRHYGRPEAS